LCTVHRGAGRGVTRADACVQANSCDEAPEHTFLLLVKWTRKSDEEPELIKAWCDQSGPSRAPSESFACGFAAIPSSRTRCVFDRARVSGRQQLVAAKRAVATNPAEAMCVG
jgi:hypothetical protein